MSDLGTQLEHWLTELHCGNEACAVCSTAKRRVRGLFREVLTDVLKDGAEEALIALECGTEEGITKILEHYGIKNDILR